MKFDVLNRYSGAVQFAAEIECEGDELTSIKIRLAVRWALKTGANLADANLAGANLAGANLADANLADANLAGAIGAELVIARIRILPEGTLIGWKKLERGVIAKLEIPADARRSSAFGRKCRAEFVKVLEVIGADVGKSMYDNGKTEYRVGEIVKPHMFDENWQEECAGGTHFYITKEEAEAHL